MNKKIAIIGSAAVALYGIACGNSQNQQANTAMTVDSTLNTLTEQETKDGFALLFDGKSFTGWRGYSRTDMPKKWVIDSGAIHIQGSGNGEAGASDGGDIIFDKKYKNFTLTFEWKVAKGSNSGVFYYGQEIKDKPLYMSAPEYQILDNENHPDAKLGKDNDRKSASLYDMIPAKPQNSKSYGEWNTGSIMVYKGTVVHTQNGQDVVEYHMWTPEWKKMINNSKFKGVETMLNVGGKDHEGFIGLQDHGDDVWYRNIKIKVMD